MKRVNKQIQNFLISFMAGCIAVVFTMTFLDNADTTSSALSADTRSYDTALPDQEVSVSNSKVFPADYLSSVGEVADITVMLFDQFGAPVVGHKLKLMPSASDVSIYAANDTTTSTGEATFQVLSATEGKVSFSVLDESSGQTLDERSNIVFFDSYDYIFGAVGSSSGAVSSLKFENVQDDISAGDYVSFTVSASDDLDQTVTDYDGKIRFSVVSGDSNYVDLPTDYQFSAADLGSHTFSLALNFQQPGNYFVEARDLEDTELYGSYGFVVKGAAGSSATSGTLAIGSPVSGTYSSGVQVISGTAPIGSRVKIFDNEVEMALVVADVNGEFKYTTSRLTDGAHGIYVALVNDIGTIIAVSSTVNLQIDTQAPELGEIVVEPSSSVGASEPVTVKFFNSEPLTDAAVVLNGSLYQMLDSGEGFYEASFIAPNVQGEFPLSFIIVDQLGNESRYDDAASLSVGTAVISSSAVDDVTNVKLTASSNRVTLNWDAVDSALNYRVYYGVSPNELINAVDTFTNSTTWYVPNLKNGTEYYFSVVAVNAKGDMSPHFSNIVSAVPGGVVQVDLNVDLGIGGSDAINEMESDVSETGPGVTLLVLFSLIAGYFYSKSSRAKRA